MLTGDVRGRVGAGALSMHALSQLTVLVHLMHSFVTRVALAQAIELSAELSRTLSKFPRCGGALADGARRNRNTAKQALSTHMPAAENHIGLFAFYNCAHWFHNRVGMCLDFVREFAASDLAVAGAKFAALRGHFAPARNLALADVAADPLGRAHS